MIRVASATSIVVILAFMPVNMTSNAIGRTTNVSTSLRINPASIVVIICEQFVERALFRHVVSNLNLVPDSKSKEISVGDKS